MPWSVGTATHLPCLDKITIPTQQHTARPTSSPIPAPLSNFFLLFTLALLSVSHLFPPVATRHQLEDAEVLMNVMLESIASRGEAMLAVVRLQALTRGFLARARHGDDVETARVVASARHQMKSSMNMMEQVSMWSSPMPTRSPDGSFVHA